MLKIFQFSEVKTEEIEAIADLLIQIAVWSTSIREFMGEMNLALDIEMHTQTTDKEY